MSEKNDIENEKSKLASYITTKITLLLDILKKEKPEKEFTITVYEPNMYWCVNWKSTKRWKTDRYLREYFQFRIWTENQKYAFVGEHRVIDLFEHLSDHYFLYKEKTLDELLSMSDEIIQKMKEAVLEAVDKEFDPSF
jgi:hypothetical protein